MELRLKYGEKILTAELPDFFVKKNNGKAERQFFELHAKHIATLQKPTAIINQALNRTLGSYPFDRIFRGTRNILIVTPDLSAALEMETCLAVLKKRFNDLHVPDEEIRLLITTDAEALSLARKSNGNLSELVGEKIRVFRHNPQDHKALEYVGQTRRGTPVFVNRLLLEADYVLLCGSAAAHPFAGYSNGPRLILPGCAGAETIRRHFHQAVDSKTQEIHARCYDGMIDSNPLQEDSREAFRFITTNFLLHTILNDQRQIIGAVAGEPLQAFSASCKALDSMCRTTLATAAHLVIASCGGYPNDSDLSAAYAALQRATQIARPDGVVIFIAECRDGIGEALMPLFDTPPTTSNFMTALLVSRLFRKKDEPRVILVSALPPPLVEQLGFIPASSLSAALTQAEKFLTPTKPRLTGEIFSAVLISNGTFSIPHLI